MMFESDTVQMNSSSKMSRSKSEPPKNSDYVFNRGGIDFDEEEEFSSQKQNDSDNQRVYIGFQKDHVDENRTKLLLNMFYFAFGFTVTICMFLGWILVFVEVHNTHRLKTDMVRTKLFNVSCELSINPSKMLKPSIPLKLNSMGDICYKANLAMTRFCEYKNNSFDCPLANLSDATLNMLNILLNFSIKNETFLSKSCVLRSKIVSIGNLTLENKTTINGILSLLFDYKQDDKYSLGNDSLGFMTDLEKIFSRCDWFNFKIEKLIYK